MAVVRLSQHLVCTRSGGYAGTGWTAHRSTSFPWINTGLTYRYATCYTGTRYQLAIWDLGRSTWYRYQLHTIIGRTIYPATGTYMQTTTNDSQDQTNKRFVQASSFLDSTIFGETKLPIFLPWLRCMPHDSGLMVRQKHVAGTPGTWYLCMYRVTSRCKPTAPLHM